MLYDLLSDLLILTLLVILIRDTPYLAMFFSLYGSAVSFMASLHSVTTVSTTEYVSGTEGVKEAIWMRGLISELRVP
jgi:hypothetical protein